MAHIQQNVEDRTFKTLIKRYTQKRDWQMVENLLRDYGRILEDREDAAASSR